jgi:hypothetical protein
MKKKGMMEKKSLAKPTNVFKRSPKKPGDDDMPGRMRGGKQPGNLAKKLAGKRI